MGHRFRIETFWGDGFDIEKRPDKWCWKTDWEGDSFLAAIYRLYHTCFHELDPDMWTCREHYESLDPVTPFNELPNLYEEEI